MSKAENAAQIDQIITRNVSNIIQAEELTKLLHGDKKLKVYLGVDPSSPEIHLGHAVVLWKLRQFQDLGHQIILLVGDFTAQIGDPTGRTKERIPLSHEVVLGHAEKYQAQASKILNFSGDNPAKIMFNSAWLAKLDLQSVIELASQFTVQQMIERDMFQQRLKNNQPIGLHEFLYPLLQGYDSVMMDVDVEVGGNDQLFNMKAGRTLMEKMKNKEKVVLTCDLLTGSDGAKMSKSAGNIIALDSPADDMFGKIMAVDDKLIMEYARLCSDMDNDQLEQIEKRLKSDENPRDIKLDVAENIVKRYSSPEKKIDVRERFLLKFSDRATEHGFTIVDNFYPAPMPKMKLAQLVAAVSEVSKSEARRLIEAGAVDIDGKLASDPELVVHLEEAKVVKVGKHRFSRIQYLPDSA